ncbi:hypothetical protein Y032_0021g268 [Ancylostoma ceylanicum]|uniref:Neurotransmitter-gated ion-channel ligand-binding domain-containing protein n=1 Tax=Ancylostoma ceylanicum TaxID=53326 RepID=A0A016V1H6_9BILA|nr:hypothetical protein Y032_0021g268 [Ancylostoma ceylanicum]
MLLILAWIGAAIADIPKSLLVLNRSYPPKRPVDVRFKIDVHQTYMDFTSATLYVHGTATLSWTDTRRSWVPSDGQNTFNLDAALTPGDFRKVYSKLWIPSIKNNFKLLTFKSTSNLFSERLVFTSYGGISHEFRFLLMVSCLITDINYPYDVYECYEKFAEYEMNSTIRYTYAPNTKKFMTVSENAYRTGHKITNYTSYKYVQDLERFDRNLRGLYPECIDIGFTVQRNQPRVVVNLIVPIYCVTFMDAFIYVFGYGMQRAYLLPVYATFFTDVSSIYTIRQLPHIARWFFARLFSTSACLIALLFTKELARCSRRFIAIVATTVIFYGIFSIPYDIFRSS